MYRIVLQATGKLVAAGFPTLGAANEFHDAWLDKHWDGVTEATYPSVRFEKDEPRFQHDCSCCTFLGTHKNESHDVDLYHCDQGGSIPTVIARFSGDGPDYTSGITSDDPLLVEARLRAQERGLRITIKRD